MLSRLLAVVLALTVAVFPHALPAQEKLPVVDFKLILPLMPAPLAGWEAAKPKGNTTRLGPLQITNVEAEYTKGGSKAKVLVIDYAFQREIMKGLAGGWQLTHEDSDGYAKTVTIDGNGGYETWKAASKEFHLILICADRFMVHVEVKGEAPEVGREWMKKIDLKALAALK